MRHLLVDLVGRLGYLVVLLGVGIESMGVPVPGETTLLAGTVAAATGTLQPWGVALAGWGGAVLGDNAGYWIGRRWGARLTQVRGIRRVYDEHRRAVAEQYIARRGWIAVFLGRFVAVLRIFAGPLAGMHGMPWRTFLLANASGAALWVGAVVAVGLAIGNNLDRLDRIVSSAGYAGLGLVVLVVVLAVAWHRRRVHQERRRGRELLAEQGRPTD